MMLEETASSHLSCSPSLEPPTVNRSNPRAEALPLFWLKDVSLSHKKGSDDEILVSLGSMARLCRKRANRRTRLAAYFARLSRISPHASRRVVCVKHRPTRAQTRLETRRISPKTVW